MPLYTSPSEKPFFLVDLRRLRELKRLRFLRLDLSQLLASEIRVDLAGMADLKHLELDFSQNFLESISGILLSLQVVNWAHQPKFLSIKLQDQYK